MPGQTPRSEFPFGSLPEFAERVKFHLNHPETSIDEYRQQVRTKLTERVLGVHRLYIDTNHWTHLRDAHQRRPRDKAYYDLLDIVGQLVSDRALVVVCSETVVNELFHQSDRDSRRRSAKVLDHLTQGVAIASFRERKELELAQWIFAIHDGSSPLPIEHVWTSLPHLYGPLSIELQGVPAPLATATLKTIEDFAHKYGVSGSIEEMPYHKSPIVQARTQAKELTTLKRTSWRDQGDYRDVWLEEAMGYFDAAFRNPTPFSIRQLRRLPLAGELEEDLLVPNAKRAFQACERLGVTPKCLPGLRVLAGANARIRTEPGRAFKQGDADDLMHACAAVPYCDSFLTDKSLRHLLTTPPSRLSDLYGCEILATPREAISYLGDLSG